MSGRRPAVFSLHLISCPAGRCSDKAASSEVIPRRCAVECTFGSKICWRRHACDYEQRLDVSEAIIFVAIVALVLRRVACR